MIDETLLTSKQRRWSGTHQFTKSRAWGTPLIHERIKDVRGEGLRQGTPVAVVRVGERALVDAADAVLEAVQQARLIRHAHTTASAC